MAQYSVRIDKQGRIVIPSEVRRLLKLEPNSELLLDVRDNTIVLEPVHRDLSKAVDEWYKKMLEMKIEARGLKIEPSMWMSEEYVRRKLRID